MLAVSLTACGTPANTVFSADDLKGKKIGAQLGTTGYIYAGDVEDAAFPPYGYQDENGEYVGFDLDLAAEVCKRNDWELVKQPIDWNAKDMELNSGTISCTFSQNKTSHTDTERSK